jgi:CRP-like cAMP-binding protein
MVHMRDDKAEASQAHTSSTGSGEILRLHAGEFFGENAVNHAAPTLSERFSERYSVPEEQKRSANVVAVGRVIALQLNASDFHALVGDLAAAIEKNFSRKVIDSIPLFTPLNDEQKEQFASMLNVVRYAKDELIVKQGDENSSFYVVKAGAVELVQEDQLGREQSLAKLGPTDFFGEMALLSPEMASHSGERAAEMTPRALPAERCAASGAVRASQLCSHPLASPRPRPLPATVPPVTVCAAASQCARSRAKWWSTRSRRPPLRTRLARSRRSRGRSRRR